MNILTFALALYFAAILGVSALAKLEQPATFAATLRRNNILPEWSINGVCRFFPLVEISAAVLLVAGIIPLLSALLIVVLFVGFLVVKAWMVVTRRVSDCGCFGVAYSERVDGASVATAAALVGLAVAHLWLTIRFTPVGWPWHVAATVFFVAAEGWLGWRAWQRYKLNSQCRIWGTPTGPHPLAIQHD